MNQASLYLDIDGVLLGKRAGQIALAKGAEEFLEFVVSHFDCYWLTTHCQGDVTTAIERLEPYMSKSASQFLYRIKPTHFNVLKTEVLPKEKLFYWVENQPIASEILFLKENDLLECWLKVDTYNNEDDLIGCLSLLRQN